MLLSCVEIQVSAQYIADFDAVCYCVHNHLGCMAFTTGVVFSERTFSFPSITEVFSCMSNFLFAENPMF